VVASDPMGTSALQEFYRSAPFACRIGPGHFPSAKAMQLVAAWKQLRKSLSANGWSSRYGRVNNYFSRPVPAQQFARLLETGVQKASAATS
jgi:hypothetical protein